ITGDFGLNQWPSTLLARPTGCPGKRNRKSESTIGTGPAGTEPGIRNSVTRARPAGRWDRHAGRGEGWEGQGAVWPGSAGARGEARAQGFGVREEGPVVGAPPHGLQTAVGGAREAGCHLGRQQFEAAPDLLEGGPVDDVGEEGAEAAGGLLEVPDRLHRVLDRTDDGAALFDGRLQVPRFRHAVEAGEDVRADRLAPVAVQPGTEAAAGVPVGLLAGLGDVQGHGDAPVAAVHGLPVLLGRLLGVRPLPGQVDGRPAGRRGTEGEQAETVLARDLGAVGGADAGDGDLDTGLAVARQLHLGVLERVPVRLLADPLLAVDQF